MDLTTLVGMIMAIGLCIWGIGVSKIGNFIDPQSLAIVIGGTIAAITASYPLRILLDVPKHITVLFRGKKYNIPKLVDQLVDLAMLARQSGLLALEEKAEEIKDPFLKQSVLMIVDASDPDKVRDMLEKQMDDMIARHDEAAGLYEKASSYAPAFGMIGTLIGLINMLKLLDDPSSIGPNMAVALITTLYGSLLANWISIPVASKLRAINAKEIMTKEVICEGILSIQAGENPRVIEEKLKSFLAPKLRDELLGKDGADQGGEG